MSTLYYYWIQHVKQKDDDEENKLHYYFCSDMDIVIYLDTLLIFFDFTSALKRPIAVTSKPFVVQDYVMPHLKVLVYI